MPSGVRGPKLSLTGNPFGRLEDVKAATLKDGAFVAVWASASDPHGYAIRAEIFSGDGTGGQAQIKIATLTKTLKMTHMEVFVV